MASPGRGSRVSPISRLNVWSRQITGRVGDVGPPNARLNVLFLDGHVVLMTHGDVTKPAKQALAGAIDPDPQRLWGRDSDE